MILLGMNLTDLYQGHMIKNNLLSCTLGKVCPGYISETVRCRKLILGRDIGRGCRCPM